MVLVLITRKNVPVIFLISAEHIVDCRLFCAIVSRGNTEYRIGQFLHKGRFNELSPVSSTTWGIQPETKSVVQLWLANGCCRVGMYLANALTGRASNIPPLRFQNLFLSRIAHFKARTHGQVANRGPIPPRTCPGGAEHAQPSGTPKKSVLNHSRCILPNLACNT